MKINAIKIILLLISFFPFNGRSQEVIQIEPLFEYPVAPDDLLNLNERCDYLVKIFWDGLDTKNPNAVNQIALNHAFEVFSSQIQYADEKVTMQAIDKLLDRVSGNPTLLVQLTKAAELQLYDPRADYYWDNAYLKFLDAALKNKKISQSRKEKYKYQADLIKTCLIGNTAPRFDFTDADGKLNSYFPMSTPTIIIIGNPEDTDWRMSRLRLETNTGLSQAVDKGKVNIIYIVNKPDGDWKNTVSNYPSAWKIGVSEEIAGIYDIRRDPSVFLVGSDGKIKLKNVPVEYAAKEVLETLN